jgi:hypothetical protein
METVNDCLDASTTKARDGGFWLIGREFLN